MQAGAGQCPHLGALGGRLALGAAKRPAALLGAFDTVLAQDEEIAARFRGLGARNVRVVGSLKADAPPLACDDDALAALKAPAIGDRPVLLAAQTHPGEDETMLPAHDMLRGQFPDLLTIIVPRHTERGRRHRDAVRRARRRAAAPPASQISRQTAIYIADTMGELGLFYRLAPFCFLGGTLVPLGGHNPLEPARASLRRAGGPASRQRRRAPMRRSWRRRALAASPASGDIAREAARLLADPARRASRGRSGGARRGHACRARWRAPSTALEGLLADARA